MAELSDIELADQFARTLSGNVAEWPQLRPLLGRLAATCGRQEARIAELEWERDEISMVFAESLLRNAELTRLLREWMNCDGDGVWPPTKLIEETERALAQEPKA